MVVILLQHKDLVKPAFVQDGVEPLALAALLRTLFPSLREVATSSVFGTRARATSTISRWSARP